MENYCVVRSTKEMDYQETVVEAFSLDEAKEIVRAQYIEKLLEGESFIVFAMSNYLGFDEHNRLIFPSGEVSIMFGRLSKQR
ncbi:hypothetical protein NST12_15360 [Bacillus sp. FSL W8-1127]|uniref:hypothetical protein n=1 Tax=Bacillus sp. FSL W8-1127 TaxID=2954710 RepID=UPI0030FA80B8